jgi:hypothetical protein
MKIIGLIEEIVIDIYRLKLLTENLEVFLSKNVGNEGQVTQEEYDKIDKTFSKYGQGYVQWMVRRINEKKIKLEDLIQWDIIIDTYIKPIYKNEWAQSGVPRDINQIKTLDDIEKLSKASQDVRSKHRESMGITSDVDVLDTNNYLSPKDIQRLKNVGIIFHGIVEGYQLFQVPPSAANFNEDQWKVYKGILGQCANRESEKVALCTVATLEHFHHYLNIHPDSSYWVLFNLGDPLSPYQFHYESGQFMHKNNLTIL